MSLWNLFWATFITAAATGAVTGIGFLIKALFEFRKENRHDHNVVMDAIKDLKTDVREVKGDLHNHVQWHLRKKK